ncbi:MAG: hypothetical protein LUE16_04205, partial [Lachnospiraceae bacterium]|nr:hypothetical protein [Lachnospiraceae bacterium]
MWRLHFTGIAKTNEVYCGLEEHVHTDDCYAWVLEDAREESGSAAETASEIDQASTEDISEETAGTTEAGSGTDQTSTED